jgi:hypothetical protein
MMRPILLNTNVLLRSLNNDRRLSRRFLSSTKRETMLLAITDTNIQQYEVPTIN